MVQESSCLVRLRAGGPMHRPRILGRNVGSRPIDHLGLVHNPSDASKTDNGLLSQLLLVVAWYSFLASRAHLVHHIRR